MKPGDLVQPVVPFIFYENQVGIDMYSLSTGRTGEINEVFMILEFDESHKSNRKRIKLTNGDKTGWTYMDRVKKIP